MHIKKIDNIDNLNFKLVNKSKKVKLRRFSNINSIEELKQDLDERNEYTAILKPRYVIGKIRHIYLNNLCYLYIEEYLDNDNYNICCIKKFYIENKFEQVIIDFDPYKVDYFNKNKKRFITDVRIILKNILKNII